MAVRRIRQTLGDSAQAPRFIETVPRKGYRFIYPLAGADADEGDKRSPHWWWVIAAVTGVALLALGLVPPDSSTAGRTVARSARQLTTDVGLSAWPHISDDGRLVVFASDRDGGPDLDIWLLDVERDGLTQLTNDPGDEYQPRLSPDGSRVVYSSTRAFTVWDVPTAGGSPRLLVESAWQPHYSPDGETIAMTKLDRRRGYSGGLLLTRPDGSEPRSVTNDLRFFGSGILWLPDGRLLTGGNKTGSINANDADWYISAADGSRARPTGSTPYMLPWLNLSRPPPFKPQGWLEPEQAVVFSAREGDSIDLWSLPFSLELGRAVGPPKKLTTSGSYHYGAAVTSDGKVAYSSLRQNIGLWRLALDNRSGLALGRPERLTEGLGAEYRPTLSGDGRRLAFSSSAGAGNGARARIEIGDLSDFHPEPIEIGEGAYRDVLLDGSGDRVVFKSVGSDGDRIQLLGLQDRVLRTVCEDCGSPSDWSPDGRYLLSVEYPGVEYPGKIDLHDTATGDVSRFIEHDQFLLLGPRFSPDQRWVAFHAMTRGVHRSSSFHRPVSSRGADPRRAVDSGLEPGRFCPQTSLDGGRQPPLLLLHAWRAAGGVDAGFGSQHQTPARSAGAGLPGRGRATAGSSRTI